MRKLDSLKLMPEKVLTDSEMKNIVGGFTCDCTGVLGDKKNIEVNTIKECCFFCGVSGC